VNDFIFTHKKLSLKLTLIITSLFFGVSFIGIYFHELWLDESHHFLLGRDSNSFIDLFKNTRYDGHPILWNYLIHLIKLYSKNPFYMQLLHIFISSLIAYIFLKKAPFKLWFKIAFLLSYFMLYEYTVISRNYNIGVLFLLASCCLYAKRESHFNTLCLFLALSCNGHSIFIITAGAFLVSILVNQYAEYKFSLLKKFWKGYLIFLVGLIISFYQIIPAQDSIFFENIDYSSMYQFAKSFMVLFKALFPIVDFTSINYWNHFYLIENFKIIAIILGCITWFIHLFLFNKNKNILFFVYLTIGGFIAFEILTQRFGTRYNGLLFITIIMGLWMQYSEKSKPLFKINLSKYNSKIILILITIQTFSGTLAYGLDIKYTFNHGESVASFIKEQKLNSEEIITTCESASINAFLKKKLYNLPYQKEQGYYLWDEDYSTFYNKSKEELIKIGLQKRAGKRFLYLILNEPLKIDDFIAVKNRTYTLSLIKKFDKAVNHNYYIYLIKRNE
jgi:hypothetical protein